MPTDVYRAVCCAQLDVYKRQLQNRAALSGLVLIMDSRHPLTELDLQMLGWFAPTGKPVHVLLSKADKLTRQQQVLALRAVQAAVKDMGGQCTVQLFSRLQKSGVPAAEAVLAAWLGLTTRDETLPPTGLSSERKARPKQRSAMGWGARSAGSRGRQ